MRQISVALMFLGSAAVGCSGPYEVGRMSPGDGPGGAGGAAPVAGAPSNSAGMATMGGAGAGGALSECDVPLGEPEALGAPFAAPDEVWRRLSLWLNGTTAAPPTTMPSATTYAWSGQIAVEAFRQSQALTTGAPGIRRFVTGTFDLEPESAVASDWSNRLATSQEPLQLLYATPWGEHRTGIFGETEWLSRHPRTVSRGVALLRAVFNQAVPPPPPNVSASFPDTSGDNLTGRERLERHRSEPSCNACHAIIDPLGLALEHFDMSGSYRQTDAGKPVDSSGTYDSSYGAEHFAFQSMEDLGPQLARSCQARIAFADSNLRRALLDAGLMLESEDITRAHQADLARVRQAFVHQHDYATLIRAIAQTAAFLR